MLEGSYSLGLSDLLDQNLSSYEYFYSLPEDIRRRIQQQDVASFAELQQLAQELSRAPDRAGGPG